MPTLSGNIIDTRTESILRAIIGERIFHLVSLSTNHIQSEEPRLRARCCCTNIPPESRVSHDPESRSVLDSNRVLFPNRHRHRCNHDKLTFRVPLLASQPTRPFSSKTSFDLGSGKVHMSSNCARKITVCGSGQILHFLEPAWNARSRFEKLKKVHASSNIELLAPRPKACRRRRGASFLAPVGSEASM